MDRVKEILMSNAPLEQKRAVFEFEGSEPTNIIRKKFNYWSRYFFPNYFKSPDAPFHKSIDFGNLNVYLGNETHFVDIVFRGGAKTTRTKLFIAFCIANDVKTRRKFIKVLSRDLANARQSTTDVYNMLINPRVKQMYPELFKKTTEKREETMASFTTSTGIKMTAGSIGTSQRGDIQDEARPDFIWFDDFEDTLSLYSAVTTQKVWLNMREAVNGLSKGGGHVYTCNYISERGNVHKLVQTLDNKIIIPIADKGSDGKWIPRWDKRYTHDDIVKIEKDAEYSGEFEGEYLCKPSASADVYFDREILEKMERRKPIKTSAGFKIYKKYNPSHRIGSGHDVGGGVGLDHSTSVFIDFDMQPAQVVATFKANDIRPDDFAHEIVRQAEYFGENLVAVERNFGSTLDILKTIYPRDKIYKQEKKKTLIQPQTPTEYGWKTTISSKPRMLIDLAKAIEDGHLLLNDEDLINELMSYTRGDLMDKDPDPRLTTRHFDLTMACAIAWQTNTFIPKPKTKLKNDYFLPSNPRFKVWGKKENKSSNPAR